LNQKLRGGVTHGKNGLEKIFEDQNLMEGNQNDIGLAVRENK
jgi:hypothetical protein